MWFLILQFWFLGTCPPSLQQDSSHLCVQWCSTGTWTCTSDRPWQGLVMCIFKTHGVIICFHTWHMLSSHADTKTPLGQTKYECTRLTNQEWISSMSGLHTGLSSCPRYIYVCTGETGPLIWQDTGPPRRFLWARGPAAVQSLGRGVLPPLQPGTPSSQEDATWHRCLRRVGEALSGDQLSELAGQRL